MDKDVINVLWDMGYIGEFPQGFTVLLVSLPNALDEAILIDKTMTRSKLKTLFNERGILMFSSVEDWVKVKSPEKPKKVYFSGLIQ